VKYLFSGVAALAVLAGALTNATGYARASNDDDDGPPGGPPPAVEIDAAHGGYLARIATYGSQRAAVDADLTPECPAGSMLWHRDSVTDLCAPLCKSDTDCIEGIERCAALSIPGVVEDEDLVLEREALGADADQVEGARGRRDLVDDDSDALRRVQAGTAIAVCDPFFDFEGATDADLVEVVSER